jgi:aminomethyltransferase
LTAFSPAIGTRYNAVMNSPLAQTPLHAWHVQHGGRMVDFAGWSMPVQYASIVEEHHATRRAAGVFDVSHMGRLRFTGAGAAAFVDRLVTRRVTDMEVGQIRYALMCNENGGILDDVLVYRLANENASPFLMMVVNAGNRAKIVAWIRFHLNHAETDDVVFHDETTETAMIAIQGPRALDLAAPLLETSPKSLPYYSGTVMALQDRPAIVSRTGYTGEDGCEVIVPADVGLGLWQALLQQGEKLQTTPPVTPAGLGARDTLRLEAAMPLYGHELNEHITPFQAGLKFAVNLKDRDFIGRDAIRHAQDDAALPVRVGLELAVRRAARQGYGVFAGDRAIGEITSGAVSPTLDKSIALAYVPPEFASEGTQLEVDLRGRREKARVVRLPFYRRSQNSDQ